MPESSTLTRLLFDRKSAASLLSVSVRALDYLIAAGEEATRRIGSRVLIPASELLRLATDGHPDGVIA